MSVTGENLTGAEFAAAFAAFLGEPVRFQDVPASVFPVELGNKFRFTQDFEAAYAVRQWLAETPERTFR